MELTRKQSPRQRRQGSPSERSRELVSIYFKGKNDSIMSMNKSQTTDYNTRHATTYMEGFKHQHFNKLSQGMLQASSVANSKDHLKVSTMPIKSGNQTLGRAALINQI